MFRFEHNRDKSYLLLKQLLPSKGRFGGVWTEYCKPVRSEDSFRLSGGMGFSPNRNSVFWHGLCLFSDSDIQIPSLSSFEELSLGLGKDHMEMNLFDFQRIVNDGQTGI